MLDLKAWLREQGLSVGELAGLLGVPLPTVEDSVYKGAQPKPENLDSLNNFIAAACPHHWVIDRPNGPLSKGVCQRCGESREFSNSIDSVPWHIIQWNRTQSPERNV